SVDACLPPSAVRTLRHDEIQIGVVSVEEQQERIVDHAEAAGVGFGDRITVQEHGDALAEAAVPVLQRHLLTGRGEQCDVADLSAGADRRAVEEPAAAEYRMVLA